MKIGYFADGPWAHGALELLVSDPSVEVVFICARYHKPDEYLKRRSAELNVDFLVEKNINSDECMDRLGAYQADLFVSMSFDQIFRRPLYEIPPKGTINCHAGKLPNYRGRNVLNWVLINDEKEFGITVHYVDDGVDTGDVVLQYTYPIEDTDNYSTLLEKAFAECPLILHDAIRSICNETVTRTPQSWLGGAGLICSQRLPGDECLDWRMTSREIFNFVRALSHPGPRAMTSICSTPVKINTVELVEGAPIYKGIPGAILSKENGGFLVKTGDSYVKLTEWSSNARLKAGGRFQ